MVKVSKCNFMAILLHLLTPNQWSNNNNIIYAAFQGAIFQKHTLL